MVLGPRDTKPTSTKIVRELSRALVAPFPVAEFRSSTRACWPWHIAEPWWQAESAGVTPWSDPYLSYRDMAALVSSITGHPRWVLPLPDRLERLVSSPVDWVAPLVRRAWPDLSRQLVAGGFLGLHVSGERANVCFGLVHPPAIDSISRSL